MTAMATDAEARAFDTLAESKRLADLVDIARALVVPAAEARRTEWADATESEDAAWKALTNDFAKLELFHGTPLEPNAEYYLRVSAHTSPRNASFVWPWAAADAVGFAKFTFIR